MGLTSGTKLGPYEIQSSLGAGGMGEVYRAIDTRLARIVAIKILPESFAKDADRLRRFKHVRSWQARHNLKPRSSVEITTVPPL
jgi:serine/threonine protein kinase